MERRNVGMSKNLHDIHNWRSASSSAANNNNTATAPLRTAPPTPMSSSSPSSWKSFCYTAFCSQAARKRLTMLILVGAVFLVSATAVAAALRARIDAISATSYTYFSDLGKTQAATMLEARVLTRALELDNAANRASMAKYHGVGRYSDRARFWYVLARDVVLQRPNATLTRYGNRAHIVLFASTWFGGLHKWATGYTECPAPAKDKKECVISFYPDYMKSLMPYADVVLYHRATTDEEQVLPPRFPLKQGQRHTLFTAENFPSLFDPAVTKLFNSEMTYRKRSLFRDGGYEILGLGQADRWPLDARTWEDLYRRPIVPFHRRRSMVGKNKKVEGDIATKPVHRTSGNSNNNNDNDDDDTGAVVTWAASHCYSHSGREDFIRLLGDHIPLHIFGTTCLANIQTEEDYPWPSQAELFRTYKFHLALENSRCDDYVTEKAFLAFARGQIPIYLGAPNIDEYMPAKDAYINVLDFASIKELAEYLRNVDEDQELFESYFAWRKRPFSTYGRMFRQAIQEVIPLGNNTGPGAPGLHIWYKCSMCYALQRESDLEEAAAAAGGSSSSDVEDGGGGGGEKEQTNAKSAHADSSLHPLQPVAPFQCHLPIHVDLGARKGKYPSSSNSESSSSSNNNMNDKEAQKEEEEEIVDVSDEERQKLPLPDGVITIPSSEEEAKSMLVWTQPSTPPEPGLRGEGKGV